MHLLVAVAVFLGAETRPLKVASPGLRAVGVEAGMGEFYSEHAAQQLKLAGLEVVTQREIQSLLGLERQKQLLGCNDSQGSCMAELANALGADAVLLGDVAKAGSRYQVNLTLIGSGDGRTLALFSDAVTEEGVLDALTEGANKLAIDGSRATGRPPPVRVAAKRSTNLRPLAILPLAVGVLSIIGGGIALGVSESAWATLNHGMSPDGAATRNTGQIASTLAVVGFAVGGVALVAAALLFKFGGDGPSIGASVSPTGAQVNFSMRWP